MAQYSKRGRSNNRRRQGGNNNPNRSLDSQGPEVKIRGTAAQIHDKYQALARDAFSSGDRIRGESLMQHAEHYYRLMKSMQPDKPDKKPDDANATSEDQTAEAQVEASPSTDKGDADPSAGDNETVSTEKQSSEKPTDETEAAEETRPRRRRRRRRSDDQDSNDEAGKAETPQASAEEKPQLEEAAAK